MHTQQIEIAQMPADRLRALIVEATAEGARLALETMTPPTSAPAPADAKAWTVDECAAYLDQHPDTIYRLVHRGELPHFKIGRSLRFHPHEVRAFRGTPDKPVAVRRMEDELRSGKNSKR